MSGMEKFGYMLGTMAYQLEAISMFAGPYFGTTVDSDGQAVLAFTIIGFLVLATCQYLILEALFSELAGHKVANILAVVGFVVAPICILIAVSVYPSEIGANVSGQAYIYCGMVTAMGAGFLAALFILLGTICNCGGGKPDSGHA